MARVEEGVDRSDDGSAFVSTFGVAFGSELVGVHLQEDKGGMGVIVVLVPVRGEWLTGEGECEVCQVGRGWGG